MSFVDTITVGDAKTFTVKLKEQTGLLVFALGKPSSNVPFMMPKRVAETDPNTQISDFTGSGPFVFKRDEWKAGDKAVYVKFDKYKPRSEPASGLPAARSSRSTASSGWRSRTISRRSMRCSPARSTTSRRRRTTCCR